MTSQPNAARLTRTRTPRQLERKRMLDQESQRRKRERQKAYTQGIEQDLRHALEEIDHLRSVIQTTRYGSEPGDHGISSVQTGACYPDTSQLKNSALTEREPKAIPRAYHSLSPPTEHEKRTIECFCSPKTHQSYSDCFEKTVSTSLIRSNSLPTSTLAIPATPHLADLLCIRAPENPISKLLYKLVRRPNTDLVILSAVYILAHRILRYRLFPSLETYNDVPEWLRSTDIQDSIPHPLYIDFVQFPQLRNAMVLELVNIDSIREEFDTDFGRCVSVNWPVSEGLLVVDDSRDTVLNPKFERHVLTQDSWSLDSDFARKYPDMAPLVTIR
ncbi:hypothetical protein B0J13DRAFT_475976 [Dactylonectria estremocensis]|uniref:BZIP domain-containing protein n=1 Tax=Dactylonectria estremocensis TaxID=1079267 RepID=A0A9P9ESD2_9HYPO|nr:hypothetical protein B0J13DRAFT_475976 [Dactylonectria estremocensis]